MCVFVCVCVCMGGGWGGRYWMMAATLEALPIRDER